MKDEIERRQLLRLMGLGGVVFASSLTGCGSTRGSRVPEGAAGSALGPLEDFFFMQLSDTHWGFSGPAINPNSALELPRAVAAIRAAEAQPDFVIFTGDL